MSRDEEGRTVGLKREFVALKNMSVVWVESQRAFNQKWAQTILNEFDLDKFDPPVLTKPNGAGMYHIIDGQHRKWAMEKWDGDPNTKIECRILSDADPKRAAEVFIGINESRKHVQPVASFLVKVKAGREEEVAINEIVRKAGYHIATNTNLANVISAVGALKRVYVKFSPFILGLTLRTCRSIWDSDSAGANGVIISGMALFLNEFHTHVDKQHLVRRIQEQYNGPGNFLKAVRLRKDDEREATDVAMSNLLRERYNRGLRDDKKLKRKEI